MADQQTECAPQVAEVKQTSRTEAGRQGIPYPVYPVLLITALIVMYAETLWSMVSIWYRSGTYSHAFLVAPIAIWLIWIKRGGFVTTPGNAAWTPLVLLLPGGVAWLLAALVDVLVVQQLAVVGLLIVGLWAILGHRNTRTIVFPLAFLLLLVPMGEDLVLPMMDFTAITTVWLIEQSGIPVYREGLYFHLPSGSWSVVEACSGVRYLIASVTLGLLYAYLSYTSLAKRLLFVLLSVLVPVLANTGRAYIIVLLGHFSGMTIATGVDHLLYGWFFFGLVMLLLFWVGAKWRDEDADIQSSAENPPRDSRGNAAAIAPVTFGVLLLVAIWPILLLWMDARAAALQEPVLTAPAPRHGWTVAPVGEADWHPRDRGAAAKVELAYIYEDGAVQLHLQHYQAQRQGQELVSGRSDQVNDKQSAWAIVRQGKRKALRGEQGGSVWELELRQGARKVLVWYWYRIDGKNVVNRYLAKWLQAIEAISQGRQAASMIAVSIDLQEGKEGLQAARAALADFSGEYGRDLEATLDAAAAGELQP